MAQVWMRVALSVVLTAATTSAQEAAIEELEVGVRAEARALAASLDDIGDAASDAIGLVEDDVVAAGAFTEGDFDRVVDALSDVVADVDSALFGASLGTGLVLIDALETLEADTGATLASGAPAEFYLGSGGPLDRLNRRNARAIDRLTARLAARLAALAETVEEEAGVALTWNLCLDSRRTPYGLFGDGVLIDVDDFAVLFVLAFSEIDAPTDGVVHLGGSTFSGQTVATATLTTPDATFTDTAAIDADIALAFRFVDVPEGNQLVSVSGGFMSDSVSIGVR